MPEPRDVKISRRAEKVLEALDARLQEQLKAAQTRKNKADKAAILAGGAGGGFRVGAAPIVERVVECIADRQQGILIAGQLSRLVHGEKGGVAVGCLNDDVAIHVARVNARILKYVEQPGSRPDPYGVAGR